MVISFHFGTEAAICPLEQLPCVAAPAADDVTTVAMYLAGLRILWFCFNVCSVYSVHIQYTHSIDPQVVMQWPISRNHLKHPDVSPSLANTLVACKRQI